MKKILIAIATLAMAVSIMVLGSSQPASAGNCTAWLCGTISHYSPDEGYDDPIAIRCDYGSGPTEFVYEGQSSTMRCHDTDEVYVRDNEEIHCRYRKYTGPDTGTYYWQLRFDAQGWHKITDDFNRSCVVQRD